MGVTGTALSHSMSKILLVEDEDLIASEVSRELLRLKHTVDTAPSLQSADDYLAVVEYDLIICDWNLPDGQGIDLISKIRAAGNDIPVLILTGNSDIEHKERGFLCGTDDYLTKPFLLRELVLRAEALLRRLPKYVADTISVGDLTINSQTFQVTQSGAVLKLAPREFSLLYFLLRNPNIVFTSDSIINRVWPTDSEVTSIALRKYIHRIREKIEKPGSACRIRTVHGTGYSLEMISDALEA